MTRRKRITLSISQFPICGIRKITNAATIILMHSPPDASPKSRLAIPVRAKMKDRIPMNTPDMLFRKIPAYWISVTARMTGSSAAFSIMRITFIAAS